MTKQIRLSALALVGAIGLTLAAPGAAHAGSKGKRNTALALGAVAAYGLVTKKPIVAGAAAAGALYSYSQSRRDADRERDWRRYSDYRYDRGGRYYDDYGYGRNSRYDSGYYGGGYGDGYGRGYDRGYDRYDRYSTGYGRDRDCDRGSRRGRW